MSHRSLIVNADDFGISPRVNRGIVEAHARGIVSSTSAMTRWPAAREAAELARVHPRLGVGLHVDLGEWVYRDEQWQATYQVVAPDDAAAIGREIREQLDRFRHIFGRDPDHIDSHQHVHRDGPAKPILKEIAGELDVPLRHFSAVQYCGGFYGQSDSGESFPELISPESLLRILEELPEGASELCCHPGIGGGLSTMYVREREIELRTLCDDRIRSALRRLQIRLCSFSGIAHHPVAP